VSFCLNYEEERKSLRLNEKKVCLDVGNSGKYMILDAEVIDGPEMYFQPKEILHSKERPLMKMIMDCFKENNEFNSTKVINLGISGGGANVPGLYERLQKELNLMLPGREIKLKISQGDSHHDVHRGGQFFPFTESNQGGELVYTWDRFHTEGSSMRIKQKIL
jgi:hypothetical protein